ncbi:unnamed protein product (macronuclear) [Paramecium tetraurelia]|uniref:Uncharacterized protein n=1 Tax=Paramecium tetraurelia TaxID=5888 RepID=A0E594_PARTE|nr:uncharacterized protein GSPATT00023638001 [Paramecium tetraurelia]CAK90461.1 unnamed protein product [Paramecium tetraurelia]|eukprot:XP_001457858.1 hypothetical protein (macronuclear) [Paramecium tetraurelia strain d4-2]
MSPSKLELQINIFLFYTNQQQRRKMKLKNYNEDIRFKVRQRYTTISDWMSKTIDSESVPEVKPRSHYSTANKIKPSAMISLKPKSMDTVLNYQPRLSKSQQPTNLQSSKIYRKFIDPNYITRSIDYSELGDSKNNIKKQKLYQNQRAVFNKMRLILDSYNNRERVLLQYISKLQQEIVTLKQGHNQTL